MKHLGNKIGDGGLTQLSKVLASNSTLTELELGSKPYDVKQTIDMFLFTINEKKTTKLEKKE